jgi:hypothetical protein
MPDTKTTAVAEEEEEEVAAVVAILTVRVFRLESPRAKRD